MAQNLRDMLSNRKFAIPLIALLAMCFIGLLLLGFALILPGLRGDSDRVAEVPVGSSSGTSTAAAPQPSPTTKPTGTATPRPTPTLVPVGTAVDSAAGDPTAQATSIAAITSTPEAEATAAAPQDAEPTAMPAAEDEELAETGIGWGLILMSGSGLAAVAVAARRLRLAS